MASYNYRPDRPNKPHSCIYRGPDGKQKRESFRTKSEARAAVARRTIDEERWRREGPDERPAPKVTVREWSKEWLRAYDREGNTKAKRESALRTWVLPPMADLNLDDVTPRAAQQVMLAVREKGRGKSTEENVYRTMRLLFEYAVRMRMLDRSPVDGVEPPRGTTHREREPRPFTDDEYARLRGAVPPAYAPLCDVMFYAGLRPQEAFALEPGHVDLEKMRLAVRQAVKAGRTVGETKTGHRRQLPLAKPLAVALEPLLDRRGPLFPHPAGGWMDDDHFRAVAWSKAAKGDLADRVPYDLRHTCASRLLQRGANVRQVQVFMGHTSLRTTERYLHLFPGDLEGMGDLLA